MLLTYFHENHNEKVQFYRNINNIILNYDKNEKHERGKQLTNTNFLTKYIINSIVAASFCRHSIFPFEVRHRSPVDHGCLHRSAHYHSVTTTLLPRSRSDVPLHRVLRLVVVLLLLCLLFVIANINLLYNKTSLFVFI